MRNSSQAAAQYQGQDRERFLEAVQQNPMFAAQLRAPLYEDKVVDFLFSKANVTDRSATREELEADLESEEGHVHGPGCGHDHGEKPRRRRLPQEACGQEGRSPAGRGCAKGPVEKAAKEAEAGQAAEGSRRQARAGRQAKAEAKPAAKKAPPRRSKPVCPELTEVLPF